MDRIEGKIAVVTGAASGIGAGVVERFLKEGALVLAVDRSPVALADRDPARFDSLEVDLASPDDDYHLVSIWCANRGRGTLMTFLFFRCGWTRHFPASSFAIVDDRVTRAGVLVKSI